LFILCILAQKGEVNFHIKRALGVKLGT
jgi:hypothetical protein